MVGILLTPKTNYYLNLMIKRNYQFGVNINLYIKNSFYCNVYQLQFATCHLIDFKRNLVNFKTFLVIMPHVLDLLSW